MSLQGLPDEYQTSAALQFVVANGLEWRPKEPPKIELEKCPSCGKGGWHAYMNVFPSDDPEVKWDGVYGCLRCNEGGNLKKLRKKMGMEIAGVTDSKDWGGNKKEVEPLPDFDQLHEALMADADALEYLTEERGFSLEIIQKQKLGLKADHFFRETGKVRALVYPYLVNGNPVWCHYRTMPTMPFAENKVPKAFSSPSGWDATLYNVGVLIPGLQDLVMVEGEPDCISLLDHGVPNAVGVPGANIRKAAWIDTIDKLGIDRIYICYDPDSAGQRGAQELANRIGIEKCYRIVLPQFTVHADESGSVRAGKDVQEWFRFGGGTAEAFEELKKNAPLFVVEGVADSNDAMQEFMDDLEGKGAIGPKYDSPWEGLNKYVGFDPGDVVDVIAPAKIGKTTFAMNLLEHVVEKYGVDGIFICLEMTKVKQVRKWIAHKLQIKDKNVGVTPDEMEALKTEFITKIPALQKHVANRDGSFYFCYPRYRSMDDLYDLIRMVIRRYGVKWVVFDNIQLAVDNTSSGKANRTEHMSKVSKTFQHIAKENGVVFCRIIQPKKLAHGQMATAEDADGSSQLSKDCDSTIVLSRSREGAMTTDQLDAAGFIEEETSFSSTMFCKVDLSRYSSGGMTTLMYDGATSTVHNMGNETKSKILVEANANVGHKAQLEQLGIINPKDATVEE